ncbi:DgyrCDS13257 [Dimorphilus gyrociliatus]|nr:DgyrCDS13257 [Dimorphilus gyrociliatus]
MFRKSMIWRNQVKPKEIKDNYSIPQVLQKYIPAGFAGVDKEGSPVFVELYGQYDLRGLIYSAKRIDFEKRWIVNNEGIMDRLAELSVKSDKPIDGITVILDCSGIGLSFLWMPGIELLSHLGKLSQDNYPEIVKKTFIINAPTFFTVLWGIFRKFITDEMAQKISVLGKNYREQLLQYIDVNELPKFLGGNLTDENGDPRCKLMIPQNGKVDEKYYLKEMDISHMQKVTISNGGDFNVKLDIKKIGTILRWEFKTEDYDIAFGITLQDNTKIKHILPLKRVNSHFVPEDGAITCEKVGTYVIKFDNSHSWTRNKILYYNVDYIEPEEEKKENLSEDIDDLNDNFICVKL